MVDAIRGRREAQRLEARDRLVLAWQIGRFVGTSKMPSLDKVLKAAEPRKPIARMSTALIESALDAWVAFTAPAAR
jgi:hypothetical protein